MKSNKFGSLWGATWLWQEKPSQYLHYFCLHLKLPSRDKSSMALLCELQTTERCSSPFRIKGNRSNDQERLTLHFYMSLNINILSFACKSLLATCVLCIVTITFYPSQCITALNMLLFTLPFLDYFFLFLLM